MNVKNCFKTMGVDLPAAAMNLVFANSRTRALFLTVMGRDALTRIVIYFAVFSVSTHVLVV